MDEMIIRDFVVKMECDYKEGYRKLPKEDIFEKIKLSIVRVSHEWHHTHYEYDVKYIINNRAISGEIYYGENLLNDEILPYNHIYHILSNVLKEKLHEIG